MKTFLRFSFAVMLIIAVFSCGKDEDSTPTAAEGQLITTIDGSNATFQVYAFKVTEEGATVVYVMGISDPNTAQQKTFALYVYGSSVTARTYTVPTYTDGYEYDPLAGYGMGIYWEGSTPTETTEWVSFGIEGSSGTITITEITDSHVKGSFDLTMVNMANTTNTMSFEGSFNAAFMAGY